METSKARTPSISEQKSKADEKDVELTAQILAAFNRQVWPFYPLRPQQQPSFWKPRRPHTRHTTVANIRNLPTRVNGNLELFAATLFAEYEAIKNHRSSKVANALNAAITAMRQTSTFRATLEKLTAWMRPLDPWTKVERRANIYGFMKNNIAQTYFYHATKLLARKAKKEKKLFKRNEQEIGALRDAAHELIQHSIMRHDEDDFMQRRSRILGKLATLITSGAASDSRLLSTIQTIYKLVSEDTGTSIFTQDEERVLNKLFSGVNSGSISITSFHPITLHHKLDPKDSNALANEKSKLQTKFHMLYRSCLLLIKGSEFTTGTFIVINPPKLAAFFREIIADKRLNKAYGYSLELEDTNKDLLATVINKIENLHPDLRPAVMPEPFRPRRLGWPGA